MKSMFYPVAAIAAALLAFLLHACGDQPVVEGYKPEKPVEFPHDVHTGENGIDCQYCHMGTTKNKKGKLPVADVCANCHKTVGGSDSSRLKSTHSE